MNLSLVDAFGRFGAKPANRLRGHSAIASDGALVLSLLILQVRPSRAGCVAL